MRWIAAAALSALAACAAPVPQPAPVPKAELAFAVPGRGAKVPFVEHEAEAAVYKGQLIGPDRKAKTLAGEASGRMAVTLGADADQVEFTLVQPANGLTVRYSIPDGSTGTMKVNADGALVKELPLPSKYSWFYGGFPFTNNPADGSAHHFYDHTRGLLGRDFPAGTKIALKCLCTIDLADFEQVARPLSQHHGSVDVTTFGADPSGAKDSSVAFEAALKAGDDVWIPPGSFKIAKHLTVETRSCVARACGTALCRAKALGYMGSRPESTSATSPSSAR